MANKAFVQIIPVTGKVEIHVYRVNGDVDAAEQKLSKMYGSDAVITWNEDSSALAASFRQQFGSDFAGISAKN